MKNYFRNIIFTKTPLKALYRFEDYFQVYPMNLEKCPNNKRAKHFPCIIEYWVDDKEVKHVQPLGSEAADRMISRTTAQTNRLIEITNLLSLVTNHRFFFYRTPEEAWIMPMPEVIDAGLDEQSSIWSFSLFHYPGMREDLKITEFTEVKFESVQTITKKLYYFNDPVESPKKEITFPDHIDLVLANYLKLAGNDRIICDSAIFQFCNGLDLQQKMKSLSFVSVVSSIETLVNLEFKDEVVEFECNDCKTLKNSTRMCKKCGRPIWGIAAKFREFLFKYVSSDPKAKKLYNAIYSIRSKIAHTEYLISGENYLNWNFDNKTEEINMKHLEAIQLARRSISSWLEFTFLSSNQ